MARTAEEAAHTFLFREWAARLATIAGERDYIGQLREVYNELRRRWRYVMEPGEWVHGSAKSLIAVVLGTKYNGQEDARNMRLSDIPSTQKGWGDCDCIVTAAVAAIRALGMQPFFRVVKSDESGRGGHVSAVARTPRGEIVSLDLVGAPEHDFGWMMPARPENITYYDASARVAPSLGACPCDANRTALLRAGATFRSMDSAPKFLAELRPGILAPHVLALRSGGALSGTECRDGLGFVDEHGQNWFYNSNTDTLQTPPIDGLDGFLKNVRRRWKKRIKAVRKVVQTVHRIHNKVVAKILGSKVGQRLVGTALMAWGVPPQASRAVMTVASEIIAKGGLVGLLKVLKKSPQAALQLVAQAAKKGLISTGLVPPAAKQFLNGCDEGGMGWAVERDGHLVPVHPIAAIVELSATPDWVVSSKSSDPASETKNVALAIMTKPQTFGTRKIKSGQSQSDWLTDVVLWATYPAAPELLTGAKKDKPYREAWMRINPQIIANLAASPKSANTGTTTPTTKKQSNSLFVINPAENDIALQVYREKPTSVMHRGTKQKKQKGEDDQTWWTDAAYYLAYPNGPTTISGQKNYENAWRRMNSVIGNAIAAGTPTTPVVKTTPKTTPSTTPKTTPSTIPSTNTTTTTTTNTTPATAQEVITPASVSSNCWEDEIGMRSICQDISINPNESAIARATVEAAPTSIVIHGRTITGQGQSLANWYANFAYYKAYPEGPLVIPETAQQYADAWNRIKAVVVKEMAKTKTKLPDIEPDPQPDPGPLPDPGPYPDPDPQPKQSIPWWPIAAAAAALVLLK